ncbi:MAG: PSD1 and planctomycete cytochrome C domain-containing protein [Rhodothermaceae bacterium]|nr:PSD1 and planctomycete cytochrome C domain-containing protein [Rhodothermaceae bacterium]
MYRSCIFLAFYFLFVGCGGVSEEEAELIFVHEVQPLLQAKCYACHGEDPDEVEGDFDIRSLDGMLAGGESGEPALVPGDPDRSRILEAVTWVNPDLEMPPKENDRLSTQQIDRVHQWISGGAPWPEAGRFAELLRVEWEYADGIQVATSGGLSQEWTNRRYKPEDLWAYQPVGDYTVPARYLKDRKNGHPVDAFINRKLSKQKIPMTVRADLEILIRRATFGLTGLPPTPEDVDAFVSDSDADAFEKVIERLLESPGYGEHWGRHWLDVVRYADTNGFANDYERPNAWRYRDYVIRSFNNDLPYDQFILEQLAGDELDPGNPEMLIATGFLRMGPWEHTGMSVVAETRQFYLDDVTNSVGETFLANPLRCARCHDHKFDPIPTQDYYKVQAVFAPVQFAARNASFLPSENLVGFEKGKERLLDLKAETQRESEQIRDKEEAAAKAWFEARGKPYLSKRDRRKLPDDQQPPRYHGLTHQDLGYRKLLNKRMQLVHRELDRYDSLAFSIYNGPAVSNPHSVRRHVMPDDRSGNPQSTFILTGGSVHAPSDSVGPGVLSALHITDDSLTQNKAFIPDSMNGRRLAFARWLTQPDHPITARAMVNRIWQYHFGAGLAGNPNNFGVMGKKPTHPELLDWLARYFVDSGWSVKAMHRLIMTSEVYQRSSNHPRRAVVDEKDPNNALLSYFTTRRLTADELRDAMLFTSGELNRDMGGLPVKPEINMEVALQPRHIMGSVAPAYQPSQTPDERNRRTIYTYRYRGLPDPLLDVFNQPSADVSCEQRTTSTVTPQVFTLFNSQHTTDRALAMAVRVNKLGGTIEDQVRHAIELAWNRSANDDEVAESVDYVQKMVAYHTANPPEVIEYPTRVKRTMFEEMTGASFEYEERLDVYEDYVADVKAWEVSEEIRALGDLCRVLFNANEFIYVY